MGACHFLGLFAKFQKVTVSSVGLSLHPHGTTWLLLDRLSWNLLFERVLKLCQENSSFITIWQE